MWARQGVSISDSLRERHDTFNRNLSGLAMGEMLKTDLQMLEYAPRAGLNFHQLANFLAKKQAMINVKKTDNRCFVYVVLSAIHPRAKDP